MTIDQGADRGGYFLPLNTLATLPDPNLRAHLLKAATDYHENEPQWTQRADQLRILSAAAGAALASASPHEPMMCGRPPSIADAFQRRSVLREKVAAALASHGGVLLTGPGGVGKTQLAASVYVGIEGDPDPPALRIWVDGSDLRSMVSGFAAACRMVRPDLAEKDLPEPVLATTLLDWLGSTKMSWLVVIDDLMIEPRDVRGWWPPRSGNGAVLVSTQRRDPAYRASHRLVLEVDVFAQEESRAYVRERTSEGDTSGDLVDVLADALGNLPLALAQATAVLQVSGWNLAYYLEQFYDRGLRLEDLFPASVPADEYIRTVATTSSLAMQQARSQGDSELIDSVALVASCLESSGTIELLFYTAPIPDFLKASRQQQSNLILRENQRDDILRTIRVLHMFCILTHNRDAIRLRPAEDEPPDLVLRTGVVRMHKLTQRVVRESRDPRAVVAALRACADALHMYWPSNPQALTLEWLMPNAKVVLEELESRDLPWLYDGDIHQAILEYVEGLAALGHDLDASATARRHLLQVRPWITQPVSYFAAEDLTRLTSVAALGRARLVGAQAEQEPDAVGSTLFLDLARELGEFLPDYSVEIWRARFDAATWRFFEGQRRVALQDQFKLLAAIREYDPLGLTYLGVTIIYWTLREIYGDHQTSGFVLQQLLPRAVGAFGEDAEVVLIGLESVANALGHLGRFDECIHLMEQLVQTRTVQSGLEHRDTKAARHNTQVWRSVALEQDIPRRSEMIETLQHRPHAPRLVTRPGTVQIPIRQLLPPLDGNTGLRALIGPDGGARQYSLDIQPSLEEDPQSLVAAGQWRLTWAFEAPAIIAFDGDSTLSFFDLEGQREFRPPLTGIAAGIFRLETAPDHGSCECRRYAVVQSQHTHLHGLDLLTGETWPIETSRVFSYCVGCLGAEGVVVVWTYGDSINVSPLRPGSDSAVRRVGEQSGPIPAVRIARLADGAPAVVAGDTYGGLALWPLDGTGVLGEVGSPYATVKQLLVANSAGVATVLAVEFRGVLRAWPMSGEQWQDRSRYFDSFSWEESSDIAGLVSDHEGGDLVVCQHETGLLRVLDAASGLQVADDLDVGAPIQQIETSGDIVVVLTAEGRLLTICLRPSHEQQQTYPPNTEAQ